MMGLPLRALALSPLLLAGAAPPPAVKLRVTIVGYGLVRSITPHVDIDCRAAPPPSGAVGAAVPSLPGAVVGANRCAADLAPGRKILFTAEPASGYQIKRWSRPECAAKPACIVTVGNSNGFVTVAFETKLPEIH